MDKSSIQKAKDKYLSEKVETFLVRVPKGQKAKIQAFAKSQGKSLNAYVIELIEADMGQTDKPGGNK